ncbi:hypothetical protein RF55_13250, partial [Lasius niger]
PATTPLTTILPALIQPAPLQPAPPQPAQMPSIQNIYEELQMLRNAYGEQRGRGGRGGHGGRGGRGGRGGWRERRRARGQGQQGRHVHIHKGNVYIYLLRPDSWKGESMVGRNLRNL